MEHVNGWGLYEVTWHASGKRAVHTTQRWAPNRDAAGDHLADVLRRDEGLLIHVHGVVTIQEPADPQAEARAASLRGLVSWSVAQLIDRYDREEWAREAIRRELVRRWNGRQELEELGRRDVLELEVAA
jgi:hypothetical protein